MVLRAVQDGTWMRDLDVGDCFLNFNLHSKISDVCGIDLRYYRSDEDGHPLNLSDEVLATMVWVRCPMGLKSLPYHACRAMLVAEEVTFGNSYNS